MNIVEFINEMGDKNLLCNPHARYTEKQQKITGNIFRALKAFRQEHLRDATGKEFLLIAKEVEKNYNKELREKRKALLKKRLVAAM